MVYFFWAVLVLQAATLGITDDEAYYWVLAQNPTLGFAYHPPGVVWAIWLSERLLGWLPLKELVVRVPALLMLAVTLRELMRFGGAARRHLVLIGAGGVWAAGWLSVPDAMLMLGLVLAMRGAESEKHGKIALGVVLALLAKFSGVLVVGALIWIFRKRPKFLATVLAASIVGGLPGLVWNLWTDFEPLRYQLMGRHAGYVPSLVRGVQFWLIQLVLVGPLSFWAVARLLRDRSQAKLRAFVVPALVVFGVQPFFAPFKLHWAIPVWLGALAWLVGYRREIPQRLFKVQMVHAGVVFCLLSAVFQFPLLSAMVGPTSDPSQDMRGWRLVAPAVTARLGVQGLELPVAAGWYQTASQLAFHWPHPERVVLFPKRGAEVYEWPDLPVGRFLFVADQRYSGGPTVPGAKCQELERVREDAYGTTGKWIQVWDCIN